MLLHPLKCSYSKKGFNIQYRETQLQFYASDFNIFQRFKQLEFDEDIRKLIDDTTDHSFPLFIILISQSEAFSYNMKEMLTPESQKVTLLADLRYIRPECSLGPWIT